jgi:threonine efflux protein
VIHADFEDHVMPDEIHILLVLAGALLLSVASPGPNFAIVTSTAMVSRRAGVMTGLGLAAASGTWAVIAVTGVGLLLSHVLWLDVVVRLVGAGYLILIGARMIKHARRPLILQTERLEPGWSAMKKGYVVSMTNPKSIAFYGSIFALMLPAHAPAWLSVAVVGVAMAISGLWYGGLALLASQSIIQRMLIRRKAVIDTIAGTFLVGLGLRMVAGR